MSKKAYFLKMLQQLSVTASYIIYHLPAELAAVKPGGVLCV